MITLSIIFTVCIIASYRTGYKRGYLIGFSDSHLASHAKDKIKKSITNVFLLKRL